VLGAASGAVAGLVANNTSFGLCHSDAVDDHRSGSRCRMLFGGATEAQNSDTTMRLTWSGVPGVGGNVGCIGDWTVRQCGGQRGRPLRLVLWKSQPAIDASDSGRLQHFFRLLMQPCSFKNNQRDGRACVSMTMPSVWGSTSASTAKTSMHRRPRRFRPAPGYRPTLLVRNAASIRCP
jgi:hypothetical protein